MADDKVIWREFIGGFVKWQMIALNNFKPVQSVEINLCAGGPLKI
jgi:hypothetical protein